VAMSYNRTNGVAKLYRNGTVVATTTFGNIRAQTTFPLYLGTRVTGSGPGSLYKGLMDEVTIYNRALTDSEIQGIYFAGSSGKTCIAAEVVTQPANWRVKPGTNITFTVGVRGTAPLVYQWRRDGNAVTGATNSFLALTNVQPSMAGNYSVV